MSKQPQIYSESNPVEVSYFLKAYFDFSYVLCICPFRFKFHKGCFVRCSSCPQKLYTFVSSVLLLFWLIGELRYYVNSEDRKTPEYYVEIIRRLLYVLQRFLLIKKFWTNHDHFARLFNYLQEISVDSDYSGKLTKPNVYKASVKQKAYIIMGLFTAILFLQIYNGNGLGRGLRPLSSLSEFWYRFLDFGKHNLFVHNFDSVENSTQISPSVEIILGISGFMGYIPRRIHTITCDLLLAMLTITLWIKISELVKSLNVEQPPTRKEILLALKSYHELKEVTTLVNQCIGHTMTLYIMEIVLGYAVIFDEILKPQFLTNSASQIFMAFFIFGSSCVPLVLAAYISTKIKPFKKWISHDIVSIHLRGEKILLIASEIDQNEISIQGSSVFPITYSTLANVVSLTLTYFLVCVQY